MKHLFSPLALLFTFISVQIQAAELTAKDCAAKLSAGQTDGSSLVRLKMEVKGAAKTTLQLQIKQRRTANSAEIVYQVLWPKERAGEAVLLRQIGSQAATGSIFTLPDQVQSLSAVQMQEGLFGSDLSYADAVENFFAWDQQSFLGTEVINRVSCQILESKPGKGQRSNHHHVRTWVDTRRFVPLRIEKYNAAGQVTQRIESGRIVTDDIGRQVPASLTVSGRRAGSSTEIEGSKLKHEVSFTEAEFTPAAFYKMKATSLRTE